ncbi:MAG: fibronectin type III domain-containing protein [Thermoplasmata archaeon]|nr:fibronectin type III domain-containing protein [Thermoplasmata archaeon]
MSGGPGVLGPFHGRYFSPSLTLPTGVASDSVGLAIDMATQVAFVANDHAGLVTAFNLTSGASVNQVSIGTGIIRGECLCGIALDPRAHTLFVSVTQGARHGWIQVLNETSLATVANITVASFPAPPFEPYLSTYDPASDQLFVQNETGGWVVAINASSDTQRAILPCGVTGCSSLGVTVVPSFDDLVVPTSTSSLLVFNSSSDVAKPTISAPLLSLTGPTAFDSASKTLISANLSSGPTVFLNFSLSTGLFTGSWPGAPGSVDAVAYYEKTNSIVTADSAYRQRLFAFNATSGTLEGSYNASRGPGYFDRVLVDSSLGGIVTVGSLNNTTGSFLMPSLTPRVWYSSFPYFQSESAVDYLTGVFFVASLLPAQVQAFSESTGQLLWTIYPPSPVFNTLDIAIDPSHATLFVTSVASPSIHLYDAGSGSASGSIPLGHPALALGVDSMNQLLYAVESGRVQIFSTATHLLQGTVVVPGLAACAVVVDPALGSAFLLNCNAPNGNVTTVNGVNDTLGRTYGTGSNPVSGAVVDTGILVVANEGASNLTRIDPSAGAELAAVSVAPFIPTGVLDDPGDGLAFVTSVINDSAELFDASSMVSVGTLPAAQGIYRGAFDNQTGTLIAPLIYAGRVEVYTGITHPDAPAAPGVESGNNTLWVSWGAPHDGGAPILSYNVSLSTGPTGPWTVTATTNGSQVNLTGLNDGVTYYLTVDAENFAGTGPESPALSGVPAGVPYPPTGVTTTNATNSTLNVSWGPPFSTGGSAVLNFTIEYAVAGSGTWSYQSAGTALSAHLTGLAPATNYTIRVLAWNAKGPSNPATPWVGRTLASPVLSSPPSGPPARLGPLAVEVWIGILLAVIAGALIATLFTVRRRRPPSDRPVSTVPPVPPSPWTNAAVWSEEEGPPPAGTPPPPEGE